MRGEIEHRPAISAAIGLVLGIAAVQVWVAVVLLAALLVWLRTPRTLVPILLAFAVGIVIGPQGSEVAPFERMPFTGRLEVLSIQANPRNSFVATARTELGDFMLLFDDVQLQPGDEVDVVGSLRPLRESTFQRPVVGRIVAQPNGVRIVGRSTSSATIGMAIRDRFVAFSNQSLGTDCSAILQALSFNVVSGLDQQFRSNLQRTGTIHIVSASGAHVMILAGALALLLRRAPFARHWQLLMLAAILALYAAAAGFEPPIVRAIVMAMIGFGAYLFGREPDILSALGIALIGQLLLRPNALFEIGLQLSFVTVAALGMFLQSMPAIRGVRGWVWTCVRASAVATIASAPLTAYYFGQIPISSVVANLAVAALIAPILIVSLASFAFSFAAPAVSGAVMLGFVAPLLAVLRQIINSIGSLPYAAVQVPEFSPYWLLLIYGAMISLWRPRARLA